MPVVYHCSSECLAPGFSNCEIMSDEHNMAIYSRRYSKVHLQSEIERTDKIGYMIVMTEWELKQRSMGSLQCNFAPNASLSGPTSSIVKIVSYCAGYES